MKKIATLLFAASFSAPALADVTDFGIGIEDGHHLGHGASMSATAPGSALELSSRHVVDFGVDIDSGYDADRSHQAGGDMLSEEMGSERRNVLDFGIGIEDGYQA